MLVYVQDYSNLQLPVKLFAPNMHEMTPFEDMNFEISIYYYKYCEKNFEREELETIWKISSGRIAYWRSNENTFFLWSCTYSVKGKEHLLQWCTNASSMLQRTKGLLFKTRHPDHLRSHIWLWYRYCLA